MSDYCLVLTATISPNGAVRTHRLDPEVRRRDYCDALRKWLSVPQLPIVYVENSGSDIADLVNIAAEARRKVEFLSFKGEYDSTKGKGAGEMCALRYAEANSSVLASSKGFFKVTGRLFVSNFSRVFTEIERDEADLKCSLSDRLRFADSRLFYAKRGFIEHYLARYAGLIDDSQGVYFEHALARAVHLATSDGWTWNLFETKPRIEGTSASFKSDYEENPMRRISSSLAHCLKYNAFQV